MVVEGGVVVERDGGIIEGGNGGGGEREGKGRREPNRSDVDVEERSIEGVLRPQFLGAGCSGGWAAVWRAVVVSHSIVPWRES